MPAGETTVDPVRQADADMMLTTEALARGLSEPSVWQHYWDTYDARLKERITEHFGIVVEPPEGGGVGALDGVDPASPGP